MTSDLIKKKQELKLV